MEPEQGARRWKKRQGQVAGSRVEEAEGVLRPVEPGREPIKFSVVIPKLAYSEPGPGSSTPALASTFAWAHLLLIGQTDFGI